MLTNSKCCSVTICHSRGGNSYHNLCILCNFLPFRRPRNKATRIRRQVTHLRTLHSSSSRCWHHPSLREDRQLRENHVLPPRWPHPDALLHDGVQPLVWMAAELRRHRISLHCCVDDCRIPHHGRRTRRLCSDFHNAIQRCCVLGA